MNWKAHSFWLVVIAALCFLAGWIISGGGTIFGTAEEWLFAGLIAFAAAHLP